jgi:hypothetical protein
MADVANATTTAPAPAAGTPSKGAAELAKDTVLAAAKPPEGKTVATGGAAAAAAPKAEGTTGAQDGPPEKYDLKLPDGSHFDAKALERTAAFAREQGLNNEEAQALLEREHEVVSTYAQDQKAMMDQRVGEWLVDAKADKEIGGEAFNANAELAKRVVERYGTEAFKKALNDTGLGNHPELVRVFVRIARSMSEDQLVIPKAAGGMKKAPEDVFYPSTANKES